VFDLGLLFADPSVGIERQGEHLTASCYPNPVHSGLRINTASTEPVMLEIFDITGHSGVATAKFTKQ